MTEFILDDYLGNTTTVQFSDTYEDDYNWVKMRKAVPYLETELEMEKHRDYYTISAFIIPNMTTIEECFETIKEMQDWVRSLSYQYELAFVKETKQ